MSTIWSVVKSLPSIVAIAVGILYLFGVITTAAHLSRFGITTIALLRAQYLVAGLWATAPLVVGVLAAAWGGAGFLLSLDESLMPNTVLGRIGKYSMAVFKALSLPVVFLFTGFLIVFFSLVIFFQLTTPRFFWLATGRQHFRSLASPSPLASLVGQPLGSQIEHCSIGC